MQPSLPLRETRSMNPSTMNVSIYPCYGFSGHTASAGVGGLSERSALIDRRCAVHDGDRWHTGEGLCLV